MLPRTADSGKTPRSKKRTGCAPAYAAWFCHRLGSGFALPVNGSRNSYAPPGPPSSPASKCRCGSVE